MSGWDWRIVLVSLWIGGVIATWNECCTLLAQIPRTVLRLLRIR